MPKNPRDFGRKRSPAFVEETPENSRSVPGAMTQHAFAKETHFAFDERGMSMGDLSAATGLNYQRLTRILRGSAIMRVDDIGMISRVIPEVFEAGVADMVKLASALIQHD
ncbi:XRE family transcriptional regulator [Arthrobacter sp. NPDC056886]|uniref:XRE family transcriptional regulator n=1 Tax=Arthrobacter sp. NPDC056886 TaxID=3345960 RepID=UPI00366F713C